MPVYLLCRDDCPLGIAMVAVLPREPIIRWLTGREEVVYGFIDDHEFERARLHPDAIVISERFPPHRGEAGKDMQAASP